MFQYVPSLRLKIKLGYYTIVAIIIGLSLFTLLELKVVERKIMFGEAISEYFDTILEIRRFEKNYFLYEQKSDFDENIRYVTKAQDLLMNTADFSAIASSNQISSMKAGLEMYQDLMKQYEKLNREHAAVKKTVVASDLKTTLAGNIRNIGKDIIIIAEDISKTERNSMQALLSKSRRILIVSLTILVVLVIVIGRILARMVVKPLKLMQNSMEVIADGRFENIHSNSNDREILSLTSAVNKMLKELELRQRRLVQSEKFASLGTLLAGVAHELNNPLSNISLSCQLLMETTEKPDTTRKRELLSLIEEQTDRTKNIVGSLLGFSRDRVLHKETLPLKKLFEETIQFVKGQVPASIHITLDMADDILISADKQRMQQAFLNLIKNAMEAVKDEGSIIIKAKKHAAMDKEEDGGTELNHSLNYHGKCNREDDTVEIVIRDTGPGIAPDILPLIFDPFFTTKDVGMGSGLGLSIVHEIIEEHGGCIAAESEPGRGTVFFIMLPMPKGTRKMKS